MFIFSLTSQVKAWKMMVILSINLVHIIVSGSDQFIAHVLQGYGTGFQNARNIGLMIPDVFHIVIPCYEFYRFVKHNDLRMAELCYKEEIILFLMFITLGTFFGRILWVCCNIVYVNIGTVSPVLQFIFQKYHIQLQILQVFFFQKYHETIQFNTFGKFLRNIYWICYITFEYRYKISSYAVYLWEVPYPNYKCFNVFFFFYI